MCSSAVPFVDGDGGRDALRIGLFWGLEQQGIVGTTGCRAVPLKLTTLARTLKERFILKQIKV